MGIVNMSAILLASLLTSAATALPAEHSGSLVEPALHEGIQEVGSGACASGWVDASFVDMGCLYFNSTKALDSWDDSATMCQMATPNATLVEILTENQMAFVQMEIELLEAHEGKHYWWPGATDVGINGKWFWAPSLSPVEDFVWGAGYPSTTHQNNCMMIHPTYDAGYNQYRDFTNACPICQLK